MTLNARVSAKISPLVTASVMVVAALFFFVLAGNTRAPKKQLKPTELVVKQYEELVRDGSLTTADGWQKAARLFESSKPYPEGGEIWVRDAAGAIGEDWVKGKTAQVETKWSDSHGTIDSMLRFKPAAANGEGIATIVLFALTCVPSRSAIDENANEGCSGEWKLSGPQLIRVATIPVAIRYVSEARDKSTDPAIRRNASKTIAILKRLSGGCGFPRASAC